MTTMTSLERLHYAIGEIAYAIANADGFVQPEERKKFHDLVIEHLGHDEFDFSISEIIFTILDRDRRPASDVCNWAINEVKLNSHYLSPGLKRAFLNVIDEVSKAYPPVTKEERTLISKFLKELEPLKGDPVYFKK
jgi:hypothetical protein